jgi:hypothetical protein
MNWPNLSQIFRVRYLFIKRSSQKVLQIEGLQEGFKIKHTDKKYKRMAKKTGLKIPKVQALKLV